eukprot:5987546-Prymnesium_polylepis.1
MPSSCVAIQQDEGSKLLPGQPTSLAVPHEGAQDEQARAPTPGSQAASAAKSAEVAAANAAAGGGDANRDWASGSGAEPAGGAGLPPAAGASVVR